MTMDIATLMIVVDGSHPRDMQLQHVSALAHELGARIIGVAATERTSSFYFAAGAVAMKLLEEDKQRMKERMAQAETRCRQAVGSSVPMTWRSGLDFPIDVVVRESRAADLVVCFSRANTPLYSDVDAGELTLRSGRPTLVIPEGAQCRSPQRILVGWKESRESRRAIADAIPFLRRARRISLVEIVENEESPKSAEARLHDVTSWLKSHSVEAVPRALVPQGSTMDAFADAVREYNPDWIVAGAYGHSRLGEWIFGGVTRYLLKECGRPVFLSH